MERIVITGPSGWIGQALLACLTAGADPDALNAGACGGGSLALFGSRSGTMALPDGSECPVRALDSITPDDVDGAMVVHLAYLTKDKIEQVGEAAFRATNTAIDRALLDALEQARPRSLFVASSGAARLAEDGIDANAYGLAKLEQEARFLEYGSASGVPVLCGRIYNVAGPHINKLDAYAVSNFAVQAMAGGPVRIQAAQPVFRSFLHVMDLCRIILRAGRQGLGHPRPLDLCGFEVLEMADIAALVVAALGDRRVAIERAPVDYRKRSDYLGCPQETRVLAMQLGLQPAGVAEQVSDTLAWIRKTAEGDDPPIHREHSRASAKVLV